MIMTESPALVPRRELLVPKNSVAGIFDTSDDEAIMTPGPTELSSAGGPLPKPSILSRPSTPRAGTPRSPSAQMIEYAARKRKREQSVEAEAAIAAQLNNERERKSSSPSPPVKPIIKKSPKRIGVRFIDGNSKSSNKDRHLNTTKRSDDSDTLGEERNGSPSPTKSKLRRKNQPFLTQMLDTSTLAWKNPFVATALIGTVLALFLMIPYMNLANSAADLPAYCLIPGLSHLYSPFCQTKPHARMERMPPDYKRLMELQFSFEKILEDSIGGSRLALDMKTSEMAVRDLTTMVKVSGLACREQLLVHLDNFGDSARVASRGLSKFSSRVMGTIDSILALDEWAKKTLEDIRDTEQQARSSLFGLGALMAIGMPTSRSDVSATFIRTTEEMDGQLQRLIVEAQGVLTVLDDLEDRLTTIHEIVSREIVHIKIESDEVLSALLTKLGANKRLISRHKEHMKLLANVHQYRKTALTHVSATVVELERMSVDLEQLRETVSAPSLYEGIVEIPIELHIRNIDQGIMRLTVGRTKASNRRVEYHNAVLAGIDYYNSIISDDTKAIHSSSSDSSAYDDAATTTPTMADSEV